VWVGNEGSKHREEVERIERFVIGREKRKVKKVTASQ